MAVTDGKFCLRIVLHADPSHVSVVGEAVITHSRHCSDRRQNYIK